MKKIFAISVLSIMTVLSSNAWANDVSVKEAYGLGSAADYNIATVRFVQGTAVPKWAGWDNENKILVTNGNSNVIFSDTINQGQVSGLTDALAGKVDDTQIANAAATVSTANMDTMVPTVQRMANAIAAAVESGVGSVDMSSKVDKTQVIKANGTTTLAETTVDAATLDKDAVAPTIANVEANFVPNVSNSYVVSTGSSPYGEEAQGKAPAGSYIITVDVDENGKATYHWIAYDGSLDT